MPNISIALPGIEQLVSRPIIFNIIDQVFEIANLSKDTKIYYHGSSGVIQTPGSNIKDKGDNRDAQFSPDHYTFVEVNENYQSASLQETQIHSYDNAPIFQDKKIGLTVRPVYLPSDVDISIRYRSESETEVRRWLADMYMKASRGRDVNLHTIKYKYPLPFAIVELIEDAWERREKIAGYGDKLRDYIVAHSTPRLTIISRQDGEKRQLAVDEIQSRILGHFDISGIPDKPTREDNSATWEVGFSYKFTYHRPDAVYVKYPISVHNQFMPEKWLLDEKEDDYETRKHYQSSSYEALSLFESDSNANLTRKPNPYIRIPEFDDFRPNRTHPGTATIFSALCFVGEDKHNLLSLYELGDYEIDRDFIEFIKGEYMWLLSHRLSFFHVAVYKDGVMEVEQKYEVTPELMIRCKKELDPRSVYHVRFAIVLEVKDLIWAAVERIGKHPKMLAKFIKSVNELIFINPDLTKLDGRVKLYDWELNYIYWILTGGRAPMNSSYLHDLVFMDDSKPKYGRVDNRNYFFDVNIMGLDDFFRKKRGNMLTMQINGVISKSMQQHKRAVNDVIA